jgi:hypothetical protein
MKRMLSATIIILAAVTIYSQTPAACTLKPAQAPVVRGLKLGMKTEEMLALFPGSSDQDDIKSAVSKPEGYPHFGVVEISISPRTYSTKERFTGIAVYNFVLVDGHVGQYQVDYLLPPAGPRWTRTDDFVAKIVEAYKLPPVANWTTDPNIGFWKTLKCDGFQLKASTMNFQGSLTVSTTDAPRTIQQQRQAAFEESIRRDFKP